jgi:hypothetical protein
MEESATQYICGSERTVPLLPLLRGALSARTRADWLDWLRGGLQQLLAHHALIVAWGDFKTGLVAYEVITLHPEVSADELPTDVIEPLVQTLHGQWLASDREPVAIDSRLLRSVGSAFFNHSPYALVHGVQDHRSRYDCIYTLVGPAELAGPGQDAAAIDVDREAEGLAVLEGQRLRGQLGGAVQGDRGGRGEGFAHASRQL